MQLFRPLQQLSRQGQQLLWPQEPAQQEQSGQQELHRLQQAQLREHHLRLQVRVQEAYYHHRRQVRAQVQ